jgi:hypothetical protein
MSLKTKCVPSGKTYRGEVFAGRIPACRQLAGLLLPSSRDPPSKLERGALWATVLKKFPVFTVS